MSYPETKYFLQIAIETLDIITWPKRVPLKKFKTKFGMPFANKGRMKGLKLEAMNSKLEYAGIQWFWTLAKNE